MTTIAIKDADRERLSRFGVALLAEAEALASEALRVRDEHAARVDSLARELAEAQERHRAQRIRDIVAQQWHLLNHLLVWVTDKDGDHVAGIRDGCWSVADLPCAVDIVDGAP